MSLRGTPLVSRVAAYAYVDGGYIRRELQDAGYPPEFNPRGPAEQAATAGTFGARVQVSRVFYYDAVPDDEQAAARQLAYLRHVGSLPDTFVASTGYLRQRRGRAEQKAVDVQLAVQALEAAYSGQINVIVLVTGDLDFVPLVEAIRRAGPHVIVGAMARSLSDDLRSAADRVFLFDADAHFADWRLRDYAYEEPPPKRV